LATSDGFFLGTYGVLQIHDQHIGPRWAGFGETLGARRRSEQPGPGFRLDVASIHCFTTRSSIANGVHSLSPSAPEQSLIGEGRLNLNRIRRFPSFFSAGGGAEARGFCRGKDQAASEIDMRGTAYVARS